jgi:hypothetical protein
MKQIEGLESRTLMSCSTSAQIDTNVVFTDALVLRASSVPKLAKVYAGNVTPTSPITLSVTKQKNNKVWLSLKTSNGISTGTGTISSSGVIKATVYKSDGHSVIQAKLKSNGRLSGSFTWYNNNGNHNGGTFTLRPK